MINEQLLINQLKNKDERALSNLYDKYAPAIYGVILRMCKNEAQAQDLLQETFLTVWDKSYLYDEKKGKFYTWIYRIAKNKVLNFLRKPSNLIQTEDLSVYANKEAIDEDTPDLFKLNGSIKQLDKHHQKAIELVYFNGLTHREAHQVMDVPLGTFKSYIAQAIKKLRKGYTNTLSVLLMIIEVFK